VSESVYNKQKASESYPVNMLSFAADFCMGSIRFGSTVLGLVVVCGMSVEDTNRNFVCVGEGKEIGIGNSFAGVRYQYFLRLDLIVLIFSIFGWSGSATIKSQTISTCDGHFIQ